MGFPFVWIAVAAILPLVQVQSAYANDVQPRLYNNVPVGMNFLSLSYAHSDGEVAFDDSIPLEDVEGDIDSYLVSYSRGLDLGGKSGVLSIAIPYTDIALEGLYLGLPASGQRQGMGDPVVRLSINLYGAPALAPGEFASFKPKTIIGASIAVVIPAGRYDEDRVLNNGTNRWGVEGRLGGSRRLGKWEVEGALAVSWSSDNDEVLGTNKLEQDPMGHVRGGVLYHFNPGVWLGAGLLYVVGGDTQLNGVQRDDHLSNWRTGAALSFPVARGHQMQLRVTDGLSSRIGGDFTTYGVSYTYAF